jgi:hypothetical protein
MKLQRPIYYLDLNEPLIFIVAEHNREKGCSELTEITEKNRYKINKEGMKHAILGWLGYKQSYFEENSILEEKPNNDLDYLKSFSKDPGKADFLFKQIEKLPEVTDLFWRIIASREITEEMLGAVLQEYDVFREFDRNVLDLLFSPAYWLYIDEDGNRRITRWRLLSNGVITLFKY